MTWPLDVWIKYKQREREQAPASRNQQGPVVQQESLPDRTAPPIVSCICPRFRDTGGFRIADLTCPIHGVNGSDPGDGYWSTVDANNMRLSESFQARDQSLCGTCGGIGEVSNGLPSNGPEPCPDTAHFGRSTSE